jgi:hypothetical protein
LGEGQAVNRFHCRDKDQKKISKINLRTRRLSARSTLAEHENTRLKETLINEIIRRKRGKALPVEQDEDYHGGAVF